MTLPTGTRIGHYEIASPIGAGGMGEVFRARDTKLDREVAIKVLPAELAKDPERLARFEREAKLLASLNHPNIAHVYGFEHATLADGSTAHFLAMELVEGEDLAERLKRGAIPVDEALPLAIQIAAGLEQAHEHGIIHRDLKPANVKVTPDGIVKVLDFGLAKALEGEPSSSAANSQLSHSPTMSRHATEAGMIMGTAAYMSPEQARGRPVDKRADIWSFGVVLWEMLTGHRLFSGETASDVLAAVLTREIALDKAPATTPPAIRRLLRRCLERDPKRRLHDVADARIVLDEVLSGTLDEPLWHDPKALGRGRLSPLRAVLPGLLTGALISALVLGGLSLRRPPRLPMRFRAVTNLAGVQAQPVLAPDGRSVAFVSNRDGDYQVYVGLVSGGNLVQVTDGPDLKARPCWSPDGATLSYAQLNASGLWDVWQVPALGGAPRRLILNAVDPAWAPDGRALAYGDAARGTIWVADTAGQNARPLTQAEPDGGFFYDEEPRFSPNGRELAFVRRRGGPYGELKVVDLGSGEVRHLTLDGGLAQSPAWSPDGRHVYFASSRGGTMNIWRVAASGGDPEQITAGQGDDVQPHVSPDGKRIVFATYRQSMGFERLDLAARPGSPSLKRLTTDPARNQLGPAYSPDGKRLAYFSNLKGVEKEGIWVARADGSDPVQLVQDTLVNIFPRWSPDGEHLFYKSGPGPGQGEYRRVSISGGAPVRILGDAIDDNFDVGPQGRLLFRDLRGRTQFYDPPSKKTEELAASPRSQGGWLLRWSPDGRSRAYIVPARQENDPNAGLWVEDFEAPPRQVFRGWVTWYERGPRDQIFLLEGKPDLDGVLWKVAWGGQGLTRLSTIRLTYSYWAGSKGLSQNYIDVAPDGRHVVFGSQEVQQANIGMIENAGPDRP